MSNVQPDKTVIIRGPELALKMLREGAATLVSADATFMAGGKRYSQRELVGAIDEHRSPLKAVREAKEAYRRALAEARAKAPATQQFLRDVRAGMRSHVGENSPALEKVGVKPLRKPRKLTIVEQALKAERSRLTREARHTLGPRQRAKIHGPPVTQVVLQRKPHPTPEAVNSSSEPIDPPRESRFDVSPAGERDAPTSTSSSPTSSAVTPIPIAIGRPDDPTRSDHPSPAA